MRIIPHPLTGRIQIMVAHLCHAGSKLRSADLRALHRKQGGKCYYTGVHMSYSSPIKMDPLMMSIDKRNPNKGYIAGNVVLCCLGVNYLKNASTPRRMYEALAQFYHGAKRLGRI